MKKTCEYAGGKVVYKTDEKGRKIVDIEKSTGFKAPMGWKQTAHVKLCEPIKYRVYL